MRGKAILGRTCNSCFWFCGYRNFNHMYTQGNFLPFTPEDTMLRFFEIFTLCFDFCNGMLMGWLLCERREITKTAPDSDLADVVSENLDYVYPRIKTSKTLLLLFYVFALLFFAALSLYLAVSNVICP